MEECVHRIWIPLIPARVNRSEIKLGLSLMVPDLVNKFQIYLKGTQLFSGNQMQDIG